MCSFRRSPVFTYIRKVKNIDGKPSLFNCFSNISCVCKWPGWCARTSRLAPTKQKNLQKYCASCLRSPRNALSAHKKESRFARRTIRCSLRSMFISYRWRVCKDNMYCMLVKELKDEWWMWRELVSMKHETWNMKHEILQRRIQYTVNRWVRVYCTDNVQLERTVRTV